MHRSAFGVVCAGLLLVACDAPGPVAPLDNPLIPSGPSFILGGSSEYEDHHGSVVSLHQLANGGASVYIEPFCSGTLIRPDVVLTAAHCLDVAGGWGPTYQTMAPENLAVYVGNNPLEPVDGTYDLILHLYDVVETRIFPAYDRRNIENNIALIRLATPVTEPYARVIPELPGPLALTEADIGVPMNFAGFGMNDSEGQDYGIKVHVDIPLDDLTDTEAWHLMVHDDGEPVGPCFGDDGGPMFTARGDQWYVGGITSYGDANCAEYGVSTRADAFEEFILEFAGPPPAHPEDPEDPESIELSADPFRERGLNYVELSWTGTDDEVTVYRDGEPIAAAVDGGTFTDALGTRGPGSWAYQVCASESHCSNTVAVRLGNQPPPPGRRSKR